MFSGPPESVKLKLCDEPDGTVTLSTLISEQTLKLPLARSFSSALTASDERVSARKPWTHGRPFGKRLLRSMPPSKKPPAGMTLLVPDFGVYGEIAGAMSPLLTVAQALSSLVQLSPGELPAGALASCVSPDPFHW